jgi:hypothetical protein
LNKSCRFLVFSFYFLSREALLKDYLDVESDEAGVSAVSTNKAVRFFIVDVPAVWALLSVFAA